MPYKNNWILPQCITLLFFSLLNKYGFLKVCEFFIDSIRTLEALNFLSNFETFFGFLKF